MRGRILMTLILTTLGLAACERRDSLYIEPGKADAPAKRRAANPPPPKPAPIPAPPKS
jgi:hypothetical protein